MRPSPRDRCAPSRAPSAESSRPESPRSSFGTSSSAHQYETRCREAKPRGSRVVVVDRPIEAEEHEAIGYDERGSCIVRCPPVREGPSNHARADRRRVQVRLRLAAPNDPRRRVSRVPIRSVAKHDTKRARLLAIEISHEALTARLVAPAPRRRIMNVAHAPSVNDAVDRDPAKLRAHGSECTRRDRWRQGTTVLEITPGPRRANVPLRRAPGFADER